MRDPDVVVIGSGPNGLVAAAKLAQSGFSVLVLEANPRRPGGGVGSSEATGPGFIHDFGAGFFPLARVSRAFRELPVERHGVRWLNAPIESCHPALDGSAASIVRLSREDSPDGDYFGSVDDTHAWTDLAEQHAKVQRPLFDALLAPLVPWRSLLRLGIGQLLRIGIQFASSTRGLSERWFGTEAARRVLPGLALHGDLGPDDFAGGAMGAVLAFSAATVGYPVPQGGAQQIANALVTLLELGGGQVMLGARVERIVVQRGRACAVRTASGDEIRARRAIVADTSARTLLLDLVPRAELPWWALRAARRFRQAWGTFKVDWALSGAVPWHSEAARKSATVHVGESVDDLALFTRQVRAGKLPDQPYLVVGQQSLIDATRAPRGCHTLYSYTHVPSVVEGGWDAAKEPFADRLEKRIEGLAPGFRSRILARRVLSPPDLERADENLVGGDLGGGSNAWSQQLVFRPFFPSFRYRMPIDALYLCSASSHPGGGAHGMCGYNAALRVVEDAR